jgi:hypothetical protein
MDQGSEKKPYTPPQVIEYGDLAQITRSGPTGPTDGLEGSGISG